MTASPRHSPTPSPVAWPDGFVSLDGGSLRVHPDCVDAFATRGWDTLGAVMRDDTVERFRGRAFRDNCRLTLATAAGPVEAYLKRHRIDSARLHRSECRALPAGQSPAEAEASAVWRCRQAGVPSLTVLAVGTRSYGPRRSDSFFLSAALAGCVPASELFASQAESDSVAVDRPGRQHAAMVAIGRLAGRLHRAGLVHHDLYLEHFFLDTARLIASDGLANAAFLIDLQRIERRPVWQPPLKDLGQIYGSCAAQPAAATLWDVFLRHYDNPEVAEPGEPSAATRLRAAAAAQRWNVRIARRRLLQRWRRRAA